MKKRLGVVILGVAVGLAAMQGLALSPSAAFADGSCPNIGQAGCQVCNPLCPSAPNECIGGCATPFGCSVSVGFPQCPATHKACVNQSCATVDGAGQNSCASNQDCVTSSPVPPPPIVSSSVACTVDPFGQITGIGCCSDSDCTVNGKTHCQGPGLPGSYCSSGGCTVGQNGVVCCNDNDCPFNVNANSSQQCRNPGLTDSFCTFIPAPVGPVSTAVLQSQFACRPGTQFTTTLNGVTVTQCTSKAIRDNGQTFSINICQGNEPNDNLPCAPKHIDQQAAIAAAAALGPTCCAVKEFTPPTISQTGLDYRYDQVCPIPSSDFSNVIKGPDGMCVANPNAAGGTVSSSNGNTTSNTAGGAATSSNANAASSIVAIVGGLERSILNFRVSAAAQVQTGTSQSAASQTLLAALTSSLQSISSSLRTGSGTISQSILANVASLLNTMAQIIASLRGGSAPTGVSASDPTIALTVNGGASVVIHVGDTLTYGLHTTNTDHITSSFTGGALFPVAGSPSFCDYRNFMSFINPNFGGANMPPQGWGNLQGGYASPPTIEGKIVTAPGSYSVGPMRYENRACIIDQIYTLTMTAVQAVTGKQASASVKVTIAGDFPVINLWYLVANVAGPDPTLANPNLNYAKEIIDSQNFNPVPSASNSSWFVRIPSSSLSSPITVPVKLFERPGLFAPIPTVTLMNTFPLGVTYTSDASSTQFAGQFSGYYQPFEIGNLQIVLPANVSLPQQFVLKADGAGGTKFTTITVASY